jgi:hypothetical protein
LIAVTLEMLQESRSCARALMTHAMLSIGEGKIDDAKRDILACHRLGRLEGQGATLVDALVAIAIDGMACTGDVALAQSGKLTAREAAAFQEELRKLPPMPKMADRIDVGERMMFLDIVQMMAVKGIDSISALTGSGVRPTKDNLWKSIRDAYFPSALDWDAMMRQGNAWYDRIVAASRKENCVERAEAWSKIEQEVRQLSQDVKSLKSVKDSLLAGESIRDITSKKIGNILLALLTPALGAVIKAEQRGQVNSDLSQLALALGACHSDNGAYPERLADLAPKYVAEIPKDGFANADFIYRREGNGYLLYSVGPNGKDDGGLSTFEDAPYKEGDDIAVRTPQEAK